MSKYFKIKKVANDFKIRTIDNIPYVRTDDIYTAGCNSANYNNPQIWDWNNRSLTTVGTNGGSSAYGTFDQSGNGAEWCSPNVAGGTTIVRRGGSWAIGYAGISQIHRADQAPDFVVEIVGFRLASSTPGSNFVKVGDFVNRNNTIASQGGQYYGSVDHVYYIGKYEITTIQYCDFLTAVGNLAYGGSCRDDVFSLYNVVNHDTSVPNNVIDRSGTSGAYTYAPKPNYSLRPATFITWLNCARYCNWLHNGQGSGDTETGVYALNGNPLPLSGIIPTKSPNAIFWIPTENEWYKAAYYKKGGSNAGYWQYATQSNSMPTPVDSTPNGDGILPCSSSSST